MTEKSKEFGKLENLELYLVGRDPSRLGIVVVGVLRWLQSLKIDIDYLFDRSSKGKMEKSVRKRLIGKFPAQHQFPIELVNRDGGRMNGDGLPSYAGQVIANRIVERLNRKHPNLDIPLPYPDISPTTNLRTD